MKSRTDEVKAFVAAKDFDSALRVAKTFKRWDSVADKKAVELAAEIKRNASFYEQLGKDVDVEYNKGVSVLIRVYGE